nr:hypothetical protein [Mycobacterium lepromatosis]
MAYVRHYIALLFPITLEKCTDWLVFGKLLTAADIGDVVENWVFKPAFLDGVTYVVVVPQGSPGFRFGEHGLGKWTSDLGSVVPALSVTVRMKLNWLICPALTPSTAMVRLCRVAYRYIESASVVVCTVFDLMLELLRGGAPGVTRRVVTGYGDPPNKTLRPGRKRSSRSPLNKPPGSLRISARNAEESGGRSMVIVGCGICHRWPQRWHLPLGAHAAADRLDGT